MSLVHNERTKLTATFLNGVAIAVVAIGGLAPAVAVVGGASNLAVATLVVQFMVCLAGGGILHFAARWVLGRLVP